MNMDPLNYRAGYAAGESWKCVLNSCYAIDNVVSTYADNSCKIALLTYITYITYISDSIACVSYDIISGKVDPVNLL